MEGKERENDDWRRSGELNACKVVNRKFDMGISYSIATWCRKKIKIRRVMYTRENGRVGQ